MKARYPVTRSSRRQTRWIALCTGFCVMFLLGIAPASLADGDDEGTHTVTFGDSLSDTGNAAALGAGINFRPFEALIPEGPYFTLRFSNGRTWVERLAKKLGTPETAKAVFLDPAEGMNYAVGGARARLFPGRFNLPDQVDLFLSSAGTDSALKHGDLVIIAAGGNDVRDAIVQFDDVLSMTANPDLAFAAAAGVLCEAVASIEHSIGLLHKAGAKNLLVLNSPNLGVTPAITALGSDASELGTQLSVLFNLLLVNGEPKICVPGTVKGLGEGVDEINIFLFDVFTLLTEVAADPKAYHLANGADACITPGVFFGAICRWPWQYVFWDGIHPTAAMHRIVAREAAGLLFADSFAKGRVRRALLHDEE